MNSTTGATIRTSSVNGRCKRGCFGRDAVNFRQGHDATHADKMALMGADAERRLSRGLPHT